MNLQGLIQLCITDEVSKCILNCVIVVATDNYHIAIYIAIASWTMFYILVSYIALVLLLTLDLKA